MTVELDLFDDLGHLLSEARDDELTREVAASAVVLVERLLGVSLGSADQDPVVVLARRFARAHRLVQAGAALPAGSAQALRAARDALRDPAGALLDACSARSPQRVAGRG